eukprot:scaffold54439_cov38-Tisochrysis_lutea.AAC.2
MRSRQMHASGRILWWHAVDMYPGCHHEGRSRSILAFLKCGRASATQNHAGYSHHILADQSPKFRERPAYDARCGLRDDRAIRGRT